MSDLFSLLKEKVSGKELKLVFPEGTDERILTAANRLAGEGILVPILVGSKDEITKKRMN